MSASTKDRAKLGTTQFDACAHYGVPVREGENADYYRGTGPDAEEFRDDVETETFPTEAKARRWVERRARATLSKGVEFVGATVEEVTWVAEDYDDEEYGVIHDARPVGVTRWHYLADGTVDDVETGYDE